MSAADTGLNRHGNHQGEFSQSVGGWAEYTVEMTKTEDTVRHDVVVPPGKVIPVIFLPGVMGSNLRMSRARQDQLDRPDNRAWRPDDMVSVSGKAAVVTGAGLGGWFKNATPAERQLMFDQNETEVEYYHYTEKEGRFDRNGKETLAADARHQNVPDGLHPIPPLLGTNRMRTPGVPYVRRDTPAQIARWRGWSEVLFDGAYGKMLSVTEQLLNNIVKDGELTMFWQCKSINGGIESPARHSEITKILLQNPTAFGGKNGAALAESDLMKIAPCWYPVHAMGYNFLKSNATSAKVIAKRIRAMVKGYQERGFKCDEVIVVTHSMGGLVARALIHPSYGNMLNDPVVKVLGMYHNVMPTIGAAGAYKRMRFGFQEKEGKLAEIEAKILGINGEHATAILANAPAPLEMMPGVAYGQHWLKVVDGVGKLLASWPGEKQTAVDSIYLQPPTAWWRLLNPLWVNPGSVPEKKGGGIDKAKQRITDAGDFLHSIEKTFHPTCTYASYCASSERPSYGEIVFKVIHSTGSNVDTAGRIIPWPHPERWVLLTDDAKNTLTVQADHRVLTLKLEPANAAGDETVPSSRSACHIAGTLFIHGEKSKGYEHQNSYADPQVLASLLYSVVQIAKTAKWP